MGNKNRMSFVISIIFRGGDGGDGGGGDGDGGGGGGGGGGGTVMVWNHKGGG